jgi:hypothetical protein
MTVKLVDFDDVEFVRGCYKVVWEYVGEGWSGDYDPEDVHDDPLLRFSCSVMSGPEQDGPWVELPDSSYCTRCPTNTEFKKLKRFASELLDACALPSPKRRFEELSWLHPTDV